ncbi:MAG: O-antigen ligase family protein [Clostridiales Family XIII bacterium]|jgi:hypothetical protein|nr:O-antigen ligase family protein [Clostridiales Family XIII bacterium]
MAKRKRKADRDDQINNAWKGADSTNPGSPQKAKKDPWSRGRSVDDTEVPAPDVKSEDKGPLKGAKGNKANRADKQARQKVSAGERKRDYIFSMNHAPSLDESTPVHWIQFIPAALFSAVVILLVKQYNYTRDMSVYYWSSEAAPPAPGTYNLVEFFSHYKAELIGWSVLFMGVMIAYRVTVQQFAIKRSALYWPMLGYLLFVLLSFVFSDNRDIAWDGWNERFEGTAMILCYYAGVFFIMNSVNSERNIKFIIYPIAAVSVVLSIIGLTQATGHDFFQTAFGQKLIVPNEMTQDGRMTWDIIDEFAARGEKYLQFTFKNNEIYQTVYNINYVSFYLTLLIPLFAMMFIWAKGVLRKTVWGVIFGLVVFNFFGAASSGGMLGMVIIVAFVVLILRKKLVQWWRPVLIVVAIVVAVGAADIALVDYNGKGVKWTDEFTSTLSEAAATRQPDKQDVKAPGSTNNPEDVTVSPGSVVTGTGAAVAEAAGPLSRLDYFITEQNTLSFSVDGNAAVMATTPDMAITVVDGAGTQLNLSQDEASQSITIADDRFANVFFQAMQDEEGNTFLVFNIRGDTKRQWPFVLTGDDKQTLMFRNDLGKNVELVNVPHLGFESNPGFGSGRGYIWSASLPMIKDTIFLGHGADTYCVEYPHRDYVGKYDAGWNINMVVDKPHNMYIAVAVNTGLISLIAMFILFGMYIVQSFRLYWRREFTTFAEYAGVGIFFGISGFIVSGFVDDSTVSVMPMFYGLLATGIATNIMLKRRYGAAGGEDVDDGNRIEKGTKES